LAAVTFKPKGIIGELAESVTGPRRVAVPVPQFVPVPVVMVRVAVAPDTFSTRADTR
jgi:hypothetical protein